RCVALLCVALRCFALLCVALRCVALRCFAFLSPYLSICIVLHMSACMCVCVCVCVCVSVCLSVCLSMHLCVREREGVGGREGGERVRENKRDREICMVGA